MTPNTSSRRQRYATLGLPAAVLGALAGVLVAAPAGADVVAGASSTARLNGVPNRIAPAEAPPSDYVVAPGDTIFAIAQRFGLRTADVLAWNGLDARSVIRPGQELRLHAPPAAASTPAATAPPASAPATHTVAAGDTLFAIAQRHGIPLDALLSANGLDRSSIIYPGQSLAVTASAPAAAPAAAPAPAPAPAPAAAPATYTVAAGDTLFAIAQRHGIPLDTLLSANGLDRSSIIYPGQALAVSAAAPATPPAPAAAPAAVDAAPAQKSADLSPEQAANAALIIRIGRELGVSDHGIAIALATGMVESDLRNLDGGDRDSLGIFQQRPSTGWGTPEQIRDAERSTRVFYGGPSDPNGRATRGLLDVPGWESMAFTDAAQAVQISAYPLRYGEWETAAHRWLALYQ
ncbi:LysM peptidoglycan-binding domain-containing protein [Microbacterium sp. NPDC090003]|uniref:LysM peptidoglycan-binding domain-containing protein n=1 Tax=Microbacterium sp. NPDC090003 TaxID=3364203 RepID=UPI003818FC14